ncbi:hypothetical protein [Legionella spiritensis]|uniref:hypothetical protein n=1 Tax=Legionella spiritensis TaxID=452 RepID=UPI000F6DE577|nr:hypothetical protein [Legionella spiritensis]VEG89915.1 Uncharacterised protein [Legionella spiritensis]
MKEENIEQLAFNLNTAITGHLMQHNIMNPTYTHFYSDIFFDENDNRKFGPEMSESFMDSLNRHLKLDHENAQKIVDEFCLIWDGWVLLYSEINKRR